MEFCQRLCPSFSPQYPNEDEERRVAREAEASEGAKDEAIKPRRGRGGGGRSKARPPPLVIPRSQAILRTPPGCLGVFERVRRFLENKQNNRSSDQFRARRPCDILFSETRARGAVLRFDCGFPTTPAPWSTDGEGE